MIHQLALTLHRAVMTLAVLALLFLGVRGYLLLQAIEATAREGAQTATAALATARTELGALRGEAERLRGEVTALKGAAMGQLGNAAGAARNAAEAVRNSPLIPGEGWPGRRPAPPPQEARPPTE